MSYTGDWYVEDELLFDVDGRTLALARRRAFFGIDCGDFEIPKPAREVFTVFLDGSRKIAKDYRMTDRNDVPVDLKQSFFMEFPLELDVTAAEYVKRKGLEAAARSAGIHR